MADVGDEVAPGLLDPARARSGRRPGRRSGRRPAARPGPRSRSPTARAPRAICRSTVRRVWSRRTSRTSCSSSGTAIRLPRTRPRVRALRRRLQHLVVRADDDAGRVQDGQHLGDPGRHDRRASLSKVGVGLAPGPRRADPRDQHAEQHAHDERDGGGPDRVHSDDSRGRTTADRPLRRSLGQDPTRQRSERVHTSVHRLHGSR